MQQPLTLWDEVCVRACESVLAADVYVYMTVKGRERQTDRDGVLYCVSRGLLS